MHSSERVEPTGDPTKASEIFTWTFPGAPVSIQLDADIVARLARLARDPGKGGLLFGVTSSGGSIEITNCESVAGENAAS